MFTKQPLDIPTSPDEPKPALRRAPERDVDSARFSYFTELEWLVLIGCPLHTAGALSRGSLQTLFPSALSFSQVADRGFFLGDLLEKGKPCSLSPISFRSNVRA